jgi:hypothetical protein
VSIFRPAALLGALFASIAVVLHCAPADECLRFSDCAEGLTCAAGHCVAPPAMSGDGGADSAVGDAGDAGDTGDAGDAAMAADTAPAQDASSTDDGGDACFGCTEAGGDDSSTGSDATAE